ncbi:hypothetical protein GCM10027416_23270 [Okibacterium endophyticum]
MRRQLVLKARNAKGPHRLVSPWPDTPDGMIDLRGLDAGAEGLAIKYLTLERIDLGFARGALTTFESEISDSRFDGVTLTGQPRFSRKFERCSFRGAKLTRLLLGPHVIDCDFTGTTATRLQSAPNTVFERCRFDDADLSGAVFRDTSFIDCSFVGTRFSEVTVFERCSLHQTVLEFGDARVARVVQDGVPLTDRWEGEAAADAAEERYLARYRRALSFGDVDTMPLDPHDRP